MLSLRTFQFALLRTANLPASRIRVPKSDALEALLKSQRKCEQLLADECKRVSAELFEIIGKTVDKKKRARLLALRRLLAPGKLPSPTVIEGDEELDTISLPVSLERLRFLALQFEKRTTDTATAIAECEEGVRETAAQLCRSETFMKGLQASSKFLYQNAMRQRSQLMRSSNARDERTLRGLFRYATRMATKTTPFGHFSSVLGVVVNEHDECHQEPWITQRRLLDAPLRSLVRLNRSIYPLVWKRLRELPAVRSQIGLYANPSIRSHEVKLRFSTTVAGNETVQVISFDSAVKAVLAQIDSLSSRRTLTSRLVDDPRIESSPEQVVAFIEGLIAIGLLVEKEPIARDDENWETSLISYLQSVAPKETSEECEALFELSRVRLQFGQATSLDRESLNSRAYELLASRLLRPQEARTVTTIPAIYEDTAVVRIPAPHISLDQSLTACLLRYFGTVYKLAAPFDKLAGLRSLYNRSFSGKESVPLLEFYQEFLRTSAGTGRQPVEGGALEEERTLDDKPETRSEAPEGFITERSRTFNAIVALVSRLASRDPNCEEVSISIDTLAQLAERIPERRHIPISLSVFCMLDEYSAGAARLVIRESRALAGHGKYFSRFLPNLDSTLLEGLRANNAHGLNAQVREVSSLEHFNADLHPRLTEYRLVGHTDAPPSSDPNDSYYAGLSVAIDSGDSLSLSLIDRDGSRVFPTSLGFLNPRRYPPLHQLLTSFSPFLAFSIDLRCFTRVAEQSSVLVEYAPRVVVDDRLVISRRTWRVASGDVPQREKDEPLSSFVVRFDSWRCLSGIPAHVFMFLEQESSRRSVSVEDGVGPRTNRVYQQQDNERRNGEPRKQDGRRGLSEWSKPRFFDLSVPLVIRALSSDVALLPKNAKLYFEESLPSPFALPELAHQSELLLQLDVR